MGRWRLQKIVLASFYSFDFTQYIFPFSLDFVLEVLFLYGDHVKLYKSKHSIGHRMIQFMKGYLKQVFDQEGSVEIIIEKMIDRMGGSPNQEKTGLPVTFAGYSYFINSI